MLSTEIEKSIKVILCKIIDYVPNSVVSKIILRKKTGNISVVAMDKGEALEVKISPFDTFIQIIEGDAEIVIDEKSNLLHAGQAIIIPAHTTNSLKANERFKMISTIIKSGYEENSLLS